MPADASYNLNGRFKPTTKRSADLDGLDFYPTPAWATYALIENERFEGDIWECACGDGSMAEVLGRTGMRVISSDLYDRGFGETGEGFLRLALIENDQRLRQAVRQITCPQAQTAS